ncbi:sigma-70 family RNA polymerase sigma factor [Paenibacillus sp. PK3_47]|uniref:RNA polymerase sigma factor n=1 Tax=Paenibacillus sp. PK3_47 TaxID=2072642 RepID=UPI00201E346F|nr:sigma-70 family RNA polymerase sigma factor [Paenibacillus sp. PK3_47]
MYRVAKSMLNREEDCADAIQESILKAYQNIGKLREPKFFKTWLIRIVINECNRILIGRKKIIPIHSWTEPASYENAFVQVEVEQLLESLPEEQSQLLKLYHIDDISIQDLAQIYEIPESTIKTRLRRAREKAKEILTAEEESTWKHGNRKSKEQ